MCLVTRQKEPRILRKDWIVYKEVYALEYVNDTIDVRSIYYPKRWEKNKLEETEMKVVFKPWNNLEFFDDVVHSIYGDNTSGVWTEVSSGFHSCKTQRRALTERSLDEGITVMRFLIPKGSLYFTDKTGLIVSNKMMLL